MLQPLFSALRRTLPALPGNRKNCTRLRIEGLEAREVPAAFTAGSVVVYRIGTGSGALSTAAAPVFLDEFDPTTNALLQTIAMPTSDSGLHQTLTQSGSATSVGLMTRSSNGEYLVVPGYDAPLGTASVAMTPALDVARVVGLVGFSGEVDTTTALTNAYNGDNFRAAVSTNGIDIWTSGTGSPTTSAGVQYTTKGSTTSSQVSGTAVGPTSLTNLRQIGLFNGQLYVSTGAGSALRIGMVGSGTPTGSGEVMTPIPGYATSGTGLYGFFFADLDAGVAGLDTLYVADELDVALAKFSLVGGNWTSNGAVGGNADDYRSVTGVVSGSTVTLFATRKNNELVKIVDSTGYNAMISAVPSIISTAAANTVYRGVALSPEHVNIAPINTLPSTFTSLSEDIPTVLAGLSVADPDAGSGNIKVTISVPPGKGIFLLKDDVSGGVATVEITGNNSRTLELTSTLAKINTTLAHASGLTFSPAADVNGDVILTMVTNDQGNIGSGGAEEDTDTSTITISEANDAPTATDESLASSAEDSGDRTISFASLTGNDSTGPANESGQTLTILSVSNEVGGSVEIIGTDLIFTPTLNFNGAASFDYLVRDNGTSNGSNDFKSDTGHVTFTITEVNDAPNAVTDPLSSIVEDLPVRTLSIADLIANDNPGPTNESGQSLTFVSVSNPVGGTVIIAGTDVLFTPAANFNGVASFDYLIEDDGKTNGGANPKSATGHVTFTITEVNDPVTATDDGLSSISEDSGDRTISFASLTGNDSTGPANESGQTLTILSVSNVVGGSVDIIGTDLIFTPTLSFNGAASFDYLVRDNGTTNGSNDFKSDTGHVTFTITEVNDSPNAFIDSLSSVAEGSSVRSIPIANLLANDTPGPVDESGQSLTLVSVINPVGGTVSISGTDVLFTPAAEFNGLAGFDYIIEDNGTTNGVSAPKSSTGHVTFTITEVNDPVLATDDTLPDFDEGSGFMTIPSVDLTNNDSAGPAEENGQSLTIVSVSNEVGGTVILMGSDVIFNPTPGFNGAASFDYEVRDNGTTNGVDAFKFDTGHVTFTITDVNVPPVAGADLLTSIAEDLPQRSIPFADLLVNDNPGPNESGQSLTIVFVDNPVGGTVSISGTNVIFTPTADFNGLASFDYVVQDDGTTGGSPDPKSATGHVSFTITEVNDPTSASDDGLSAIVEDSGNRIIPFTALTGNDSAGPLNESTQTLIITSVSNAVGGMVSTSGTDVIFTPTLNYHGPASFDYLVEDNGTTNGSPAFSSDSGHVTFTITELNDAPSAGDDSLTAIAEDSGTRIIPFSSLIGDDNAGPANEIGQTLTIISVSNAVGGMVSTSGTDVIFSPTLNYNGPASFDYEVQDNGTTNGSPDPKSDIGHVSFTITEVNDPVTATDDGLTSIVEDTLTRTIPFSDLTGNDVAGPANELTQLLTIVSVINPIGGTVSISGTDVIFTPTPNFNGTAGFDYVVQDNGTTNGAAEFSSDTGHVTFTISPVNDQPILDTTGTPMLPYIPVRAKVLSAGTVAGALLSDLTENIDDLHDNDPTGIAVTLIDNFNGVWEYNTAFDPADPNTGWNAIPNVSTTNALLLSDVDDDTRVRFLPNLKFKGFASLTFHAWDQSNSPRVEGDFETNLSSSAYSTADDQAWIAVGPTKPAVDADGRTILKPVKSDTKTSAAILVRDMIGIAGLETVGFNMGVAIIGNNMAEGTWEFQLAKTKPWVPVGAVTATSALLLKPTDKLRFKPAVGVDGDAELKFVTWDAFTGTAGLPAITDTTVPGTVFGADPGTAVLDFVPVLELSAAGVLNPVDVVNVPTNAVQFSSIMNANHVVGTNVGVAITASKGTGTWEYSLDGVNWTAVGKVSTGKALFLKDSAFIRFTAISATPGTASLSFKAWDLTKVAPGTRGAATGSSVSKQTEIVSVSVANNSPTFITLPNVVLKPVKATAKAGGGASVSSLLGKSFSDVDPKSGKGIAITGFTDNGGGKWQYSVGANKWVDLGAVSLNSAVLLASNAKIRYFVTNPLITTGNATISFKAWDRTTGQSGDRNVDTTGLLNAFSSNAEIGLATVTVVQ